MHFSVMYDTNKFHHLLVTPEHLFFRILYGESPISDTSCPNSVAAWNYVDSEGQDVADTNLKVTCLLPCAK
jgi:hypothetical protein